MADRQLFFMGVLDKRIDQTRRQLNHLYSRKSILSGRYQAIDVDALPVSTHEKLEVVSINKWAKDHYRLLQVRWGRYGIDIPKYSKFENRLIEAYDVIRRLSIYRPELKNRLGVLLVPPVKALKLPVKNDIRRQQRFIKYGDYVQGEVTFDASNDWRILVVHTAINGLSLGNTKQIVNRRLYEMAGYDTRALGPVEYAALTLQHPAIMDRSRPTLLLRRFNSNQVSTAMFSRGRYCFLCNSKFTPGEYLFRPAVEIAEQ